MPRIIFMGTPDFARQVLEGLLAEEHDVVAVVTQPDRPVGRKRILTPSPVKQLAQDHQLPIYQPDKLTGSPEEAELIAMEADLIVTAAYGQFLSTKLLDSARIAAINVHASLLPKYRGGAPIHHAIYHGEEETGISIIYMTKKMDAGDIILQRAIPIEVTDNVGTLFNKLAVLGQEALLEALPLLTEGQVEAVAQDHDRATYSPNISRAQEQVDWRRSSQEVDWHIRALNPFPSSYTWLGDRRVKLWEGHPGSPTLSQEQPGTIIGVTEDSLIVQAGDNTAYEVTRWQEAGKKAMAIKDYLNGVHPEEIIGQTFQYRPVEDDA